MSTSTEKDRIEAEELVYTQDYLDYIDMLVTYSAKIPGREFESMLKDVIVALHEKVTYNLDASSKYRHKLGWFARLREKRQARKLEKKLLRGADKQSEEGSASAGLDVKKTDALLTPNFKALSEFSQNSALLEQKTDVKALENKETHEQDEGQCMSF